MSTQIHTHPTGRASTAVLTQVGELVLGALATLVMLAAVNQTPLPLFSGDRGALVAVTLIGFLMCSAGIGRSFAALGWAHPVNVIGSALGVLVIALVAGQLAGLVAFPSPSAALPSDRAAMLAVAAVVGVKWLLAFGQFLKR